MTAALPAIQARSISEICAEARDQLLDAFPSLTPPLVVRMGERHLDLDTGGNRIVFVPNVTPSIGGPPSEIGGDSIASIIEQVTAFVWAADTTEDGGFGQYAAAEELRNAVIVTMRALLVFSEHVQLQDDERDPNPKRAFFGEQYRVTFAYKYDVDATNTLTAAPDAAFIKDTEVEREDPA